MASREGEFFRMNIQVRSARDNTPLYIKNDGERFKDNRTVKICVDHTYTVEIALKPSFSGVTRVAWGGADLLLENKKEVDGSATYQFKWTTTGLEPSKSSTRSQLPIAIHFDNGEQALYILQCKYYSPKDQTHYRWGDELKTLELECKSTGISGGSVNIVKTMFR